MLSRARRGACEIVAGAALWRCRCEIVAGAALWRCRCRSRGRRSILCIWVCVCVAGVAFGSCLEGQDVVARAAAGGGGGGGRRFSPDIQCPTSAKHHGPLVLSCSAAPEHVPSLVAFPLSMDTPTWCRRGYLFLPGTPTLKYPTCDAMQCEGLTSPSERRTKSRSVGLLGRRKCRPPLNMQNNMTNMGGFSCGNLFFWRLRETEIPLGTPKPMLRVAYVRQDETPYDQHGEVLDSSPEVDSFVCRESEEVWRPCLVSVSFQSSFRFA